MIFFKLFQHFYPSILRWCLRHKIMFLPVPLVTALFGIATDDGVIMGTYQEQLVSVPSFLSLLSKIGI